ncbi:MAG: hypothetical protein ABI418_10510, partial [Jatrophihabitantaceae bacterium]
MTRPDLTARRRGVRLAAVAAACALATTAALIAIANPAAAANSTVKAPAIPTGSPWAVSLGDSYISGEAGRWAGNSDDSSQTDALGSSAYYDAGNAEAIPGCHRSKSAEIGFGTIAGANLACSGAKSATQPYSSGSDFKPGLDFYNDGAGHLGQALALQNFAASHRVSLVAVSIGGNDFNFGSIVQSCVEDFLTSPTWWKNYCNDDSSVTANFTSANITAVTAKIAGALRNVNTALANDGYTTADYSILLQTYPSPLPAGSGIRYSESGFTRQSTGGCGFWNNDANWANSSALPTINASVRNAASQSGLPNVKIMDVSALYNGRRLCETGVQLLSDPSLASWRSAGAVDQSEWIEQIRTVSTVFGPYYVQ